MTGAGTGTATCTGSVIATQQRCVALNAVTLRALKTRAVVATGTVPADRVATRTEEDAGTMFEAQDGAQATRLHKNALTVGATSYAYTEVVFVWTGAWTVVMYFTSTDKTASFAFELSEGDYDAVRENMTARPVFTTVGEPTTRRWPQVCTTFAITSATKVSEAVRSTVAHVTYAAAGNVRFTPEKPEPTQECEQWTACAATAATQTELAACAATVRKCMPTAGAGTAELDFNGTLVALAAVPGTTAMCGKAGATWYVLTVAPAGATVFAASELTGTISAATGASDKWTVAAGAQQKQEQPVDAAAQSSLQTDAPAPSFSGNAGCAIEQCIASLEGLASCSAAARACVATTESTETLVYENKKVQLFTVGKARYGKEGPYVIQVDGTKGKLLVVGEKPLLVDVELSDSVWKPVEGTNWTIVGVIIGIVALVGILFAVVLYKKQAD